MKVAVPPQYRHDLFNFVWSLAQMDRLADLIRAGNSPVEIARVFAVTPQEIRDVVARNAAYLPQMKA
ncbi:hypothetical protein JP75_07670 [Devosia riboflavina]|uniref:Uncharacterized protein n=1 Tax=Devosia riboflavina TaxID=46914 RepID=A0A087M3H4_9HYPH|nr:hypothetical protein [Devosia riboflavina]KFL31427.1 hypothetical protein JP75_07670 [Devosia riboflavina]